MCLSPPSPVPGAFSLAAKLRYIAPEQMSVQFE